MIRVKNYEAVSKFVKVMTKILWPLFFPDTVYMNFWLTSTVLRPISREINTLPFSPPDWLY